MGLSEGESLPESERHIDRTGIKNRIIMSWEEISVEEILKNISDFWKEGLHVVMEEDGSTH